MWFTHESERWRITQVEGIDDVIRWAFDDAGQIWVTIVSTHSSAQPDADPAERRVFPALLLENAVRTVRDALGFDPFPWDVADVVSNPGPSEDYLPVLGQGRMVIKRALVSGYHDASRQ